MHIGDANPLWRGKRSWHPRRMRIRQFHISGKRPMCWMPAAVLGPWPERHAQILLYLLHYMDNRPISQLPQVTCPISHNTPPRNRNERILSQCGTFWDIGKVYCDICGIGFISMGFVMIIHIQFWFTLISALNIEIDLDLKKKSSDLCWVRVLIFTNILSNCSDFWVTIRKSAVSIIIQALCFLCVSTLICYFFEKHLCMRTDLGCYGNNILPQASYHWMFMIISIVIIDDTNQGDNDLTH